MAGNIPSKIQDFPGGANSKSAHDPIGPIIS